MELSGPVSLADLDPALALSENDEAVDMPLDQSVAAVITLASAREEYSFHSTAACPMQVTQ